MNSTSRPSSGNQLEREIGEEQHKLGMLLRSAYFSLRRCSNAHFSSFGANGDQFVLLKLLADEEGVTQRDLVQRGGYDATTTGNMLRNLERRNLVTRRGDPDDARAKRVHLTPKGRRLQHTLWEQTETLRAELANCVPLKQRKSFMSSLARIVESMERVRIEAESEYSD